MDGSGSFGLSRDLNGKVRATTAHSSGDGPTTVTVAGSSALLLRRKRALGCGGGVGSVASSPRGVALCAPGESGCPLPTLLPRRLTGEQTSFSGMGILHRLNARADILDMPTSVANNSAAGC